MVNGLNFLTKILAYLSNERGKIGNIYSFYSFIKYLVVPSFPNPNAPFVSVAISVVRVLINCCQKTQDKTVAI